MLKMPLEILIPLLEMNTSPEALFIRASLGRENCLFLSDDISSCVYEQGLYDLTTNEFSCVSDNWVDLIKDFCHQGYVFNVFQEKYPDLVSKDRVYSCKIHFSPTDFEKKSRSKLKNPSKMSEEDLAELHRENPDQYWDQMEAFV